MTPDTPTDPGRTKRPPSAKEIATHREATPEPAPKVEPPEVKDETLGLLGNIVSRPVAVVMVFLAALVFGMVSYMRLPIELMPDMSYPTITVRTAWDGAAPQEVETQVSQPIEESLATLSGLVDLESRSKAGSSDVVLGFDWGTDMGAASQSIRENLQTTSLPKDADRPMILRYDPTLEPFLRLALSSSDENTASPGALARIRSVAELDLKRALEAMQGVAAVRVRGGFEREVHIALREDWMVARQVTMDSVHDALRSENINLAGGTVLEGDKEYLVRTLNEYRTVEELYDLGIRRSDGIVVPLTDIAEITDGHKERQVLSRLDGGEAVELEVFKEAGANVVRLADAVQLELYGDGMMKTGLVNQLPDDMKLVVLDDQAAFIASAVSNLRSTAVLGGLFAVTVLFLFLRDWRATGIIGLAIPISVAIGFGPLYLSGITLNLMSLGGLALGIGMLVDNAVVVLESIQRYREEGDTRREAAAKGTADVASAVVASTATTVAVFMPIAFVEGVAGELFGDLSLAVVSSLLASLAVALLLVPTLAGLEIELGTRSLGVRQPIMNGPTRQLRASTAWMAGKILRYLTLPYVLLRYVLTVIARALLAVFIVVSAWVAWLLFMLVWVALWLPARGMELAGTAFLAVFALVERLYAAFLSSALQHGMLLVVASMLLFIGSLFLVPFLGTELIPEVHQGRFTVDLALPVGAPLTRTQRVADEAEALILRHPEVNTAYSIVGADPRADTSSDQGEHTARIRVELDGTHALTRREESTMADLRESLAGLADVKLSRPSLFSTATPIEVVLFGPDLDELKAVGATVSSSLSKMEGLADVRSSLVDGHPEIRIVYDRKRLHRLGLDPATVARQVRDKVQGVVATRIQKGAERIDIRVQLVERNRDTLDDLRRLNVNPKLRPIVPLESVATFEEAVGPSEIRRVDQQRAVVVSANLAGFDLGSMGTAIDAKLATLDLPPGISWTIAGQSSEMEGSLRSLQLALLLAIFLVYVIMASTFENLGHPFVILFSVPLALIGTLPALLLTGQAISVVVFIGLIVLAGVVVNNAIVLVDTINRRRDEGLDPLEAVRVAGRLRLRPILITTATTVLGLLPLSLGIGAGAEIQQPLAVTVIGGLISSTVLTLIVIPVVYSLFARNQNAPS